VYGAPSLPRRLASSTVSASKKPTPRRLVVYTLVVGLVALAEPSPARLAVGGCLVALGIALRVWACGHLEKNKLVVTTGPYAHVKNPLYVGSFLIAAGMCTAAVSGKRGWVLYAGVPVLLLAFFLIYMPRKKRKEGDRMRAKFGEAWDRYDAAVPDFLPRPTPWRSGDPRRFRFQLVVENHEPPMDLVVLAIFAAIALRPQIGALLGQGT
jgi:protein-S-isoprenylcysteine O-methyltransferase Ste14